MKAHTRFTLWFALLSLLLIQVSGTLIEAIYILDLMHTSLDAKALGVLCFFAPLLWVFWKRWPGRRTAWVLAGVLALARAATAYLPTTGRLFSAGLGTAIGWLLLAWTLGAVRAPRPTVAGRGLALGLALSVALRTVGSGVDISLLPHGGWIGVLLGIALLGLLPDLDIRQPATPPAGHPFGSRTAAFGSVLCLAMGWFALSAPAVIARWTEGPYPLIVVLVALGCVLWVLLAPRLRISARGLLLWNLLFMLALTATLLVHRVPFPAHPGDPPLVVSSPPPPVTHLPLLLLLVLWPVVLVDFDYFYHHLSLTATAPGQWLSGLLGGLLLTVILVFIQVFTNVWGYVAPISTPFRNQFWLPYTALGLALTLAVARLSWGTAPPVPAPQSRPGIEGGLLLLALALTLIGLSRSRRTPPSVLPTQWRVMTYNMQAGNNAVGERDFEAQLALIRRLQPDILALQESDTARLSLNNNDLVRYFADHLGYYAYYGPPTVAGTFGTAVLSRFPLQHPRVVYSYSDQDEIGTTVVEIPWGDRRVTLFNVHPDGSEVAMQAFAEALIAQAQGHSPLIILGDFNLRAGETAYEAIAAHWQNAWQHRPPGGAAELPADLKPIDHIFLDATWEVLQAHYILPPDSHTDHPAHWAEIRLR